MSAALVDLSPDCGSLNEPLTVNSSAYEVGVLCYHVVVSLYTETQRQARDKVRKKGVKGQDQPARTSVVRVSELCLRVREGYTYRETRAHHNLFVASEEST